MKTLLLLRKPLLSFFLFFLAFLCISAVNRQTVKVNRSGNFITTYGPTPAIKNITLNASPTSTTNYCGKAFRVVILGSSTAYGKGANPIDSAWVNRYTTYAKSFNTQNTVINLAVPGYTTYQVLCPTNFVSPPGRPAPDTAKNITKALSLHPNVIIINLPTNDIGLGYSLAEIKSNYERAMKLAGEKNIPVWVTTSQPRTNYNQGERDSLMVLRDWTYTRFGVYAIDFWSTVSNNDGSINSYYDSGDGVHVNNAGHRLFYSRVVSERILDSLCVYSNKDTTSNKVPVVNAGADQAITLPASSVSLSGTASDADGTIASYAWSKISGPTAGTIGTPAAAKTTVSGLTQGTYSFELKATDNGGAIGKDTVNVIVNGTITTTSTKYIKVAVYGGADAYTGTGWNNWNVGTADATNLASGALKYSDATTSAITATLSHTSGVGDNGATYSATITPKMAPAEVLRHASYSTQTRTLTLSGLSTTKKYNIELYDSWIISNNITLLTINGTSQSINVFDNYTNKGVNSNITPDALGRIVITIKSGTTYNQLNGFMLIEQGSANTSTSATKGEASVENGESLAAPSKELQNTPTPSIEVYPNPFKDQLSLHLNTSYNGFISVQIIDCNGRTVKEVMQVKTQQQYSTSFPVSELAKGSYLIQVQGANWKAATKIIKL